MIVLDEQLQGVGLEEDIAFCARENVLDAVPRLAGMHGAAAEISL